MADHHTLPANSKTVHWGYWDAAREPILEIDSGDKVTIDSISGEPDDLPPDHAGVTPEHLEILANCERGPGPHFLTGPIWVRNAEPGDTLEVSRALDDGRQPVDRDVFQRALDYYQIRSSTDE